MGPSPPDQHFRPLHPRYVRRSGIGGLRLPYAWRENEERWAKARLWFSAASTLYEAYRLANNAVRRSLEGISYLGPLRSLPNRTYRMSPERPSDVGRDGQHAPELMMRSMNAGARNDVDKWLKTLGYGALVFRELGEDFFQVLIRGRGNFQVNIADSGVGLSQLLPILVQGAMTEPGDTFIVQQPEIHLNPAQQCQVTDFLVTTADGGTRVIIETHSEHVLLRLRRRVAEGNLSHKDVAIYYCDNIDGQSTVDRIPIGPKGEVSREDWPMGFFEEQLNDAFALARAQSV